MQIYSSFYTFNPADSRKGRTVQSPVWTAYLNLCSWERVARSTKDGTRLKRIDAPRTNLISNDKFPGLPHTFSISPISPRNVVLVCMYVVFHAYDCSLCTKVLGEQGK